MKPATSELRDIWKERKEPQVRTTSVHHVRWNDPRRPEGRKRLGGWPLWLLWLQMDVMNGDGDAAIQERIVGQDLWDAEALGALIGGWGGRDTHLLMYSPVRMTLQVWHLKQLTCHCLSSARSDWPCLISSLQPAQSEKTKVRRTSWVRCHHLPRESIPGCHYSPQVATLVLLVPRDPARQEERLPECWRVDKAPWSDGKEELPGCLS